MIYVLPLTFASVWSVAVGVWEIRRQARETVARKRRLEALLKELDAS